MLWTFHLRLPNKCGQMLVSVVPLCDFQGKQNKSVGLGFEMQNARYHPLLQHWAWHLEGRIPICGIHPANHRDPIGVCA